MIDAPPKPEIISQLMSAVYSPFAMLAGIQLDLFSLLSEGSKDVEELAQILDVDSSKLGPLLYALVVANLLTLENERFSNTPEAEYYLASGKPSFLGEVHPLLSNNWQRVLEIEKMLRERGPAEAHDYQAEPGKNILGIFRGLYSGAVADAKRLMKHCDLSAKQSLLDVGGGSGALSITIAKAHPHLQVTVLDLPSIVPVTRQFVEEADASDTVTVIAGDAVKSSPEGSYDVIVVRHVVQVLSSKEGSTLLSNLASSLNPGGIMYVIGLVLDNSRLEPPQTVGHNLVLVTSYKSGEAYTEAEYTNWLSEAGLVDITREVKPDGVSVFTALKPN